MKLFFSRLWHSETNGLTAAALIVGMASLASRVIGVVRDRIFASQFGAGDVLDVYYAAFRLPDLLYTLIILGALSAGFIPVFAEYMETRSRDEAWRLAERVLSVVGATMMVVCAALVLLSRVLVPLAVPGFSGEKLEATIQLTRIMALSPFFLGLSAVMGGVLQATRHFFAFAMAPVFYNVGIIFGALVLSPVMGVQGLAWGVVLGSFLHLVTQATVALRLGLRRIPVPSFKTEGVKRILWLMAPRTAGLAVSQVNTVILLALASSLPEGSIAVFNLANNLQSFPVGIFGIAFAVAAFPSLAIAAGSKDDREFKQIISSASRKISFLILPSVAIFFLLRAQIVRLVLGAGVFSWNDTIRTADVLGIFTFSLAFQALTPLFARAFYALQDTWTPLVIGVITEAFNLLLALTLREPFGILGLAMAFSAASLLNLMLLWWFLYYKKGPVSDGRVMSSFVKTAAASVVLFGFGWPVRQALGTVFPLRTFWQVALQMTGTLAVGFLAFFTIAYLMRSEELRDFIESIRKRLFKNVRKIEGADEAQGV